MDEPRVRIAYSASLMSDDNNKCDTCGGTKAAHNRETGNPVCNNRRCSESPMNQNLTYMAR